MKPSQPFNASRLDAMGLNRQAVFNLADLPEDVAASLQPCLAGFKTATQLILVGHGGRRLWEALQAADVRSDDPIDTFTTQTIQEWFASEYPESRYTIAYPGPHVIGLQRLGQLAGWHHPSPFMVGVDAKWGSWFAYRAVVLADTTFELTLRLVSESPCESCRSKACIENCPGNALGGEKFDLGRCVTYRKQADSKCKTTCLARVSCPVGTEHRYSDEQLRHTYSISMEMIERLEYSSKR